MSLSMSSSDSSSFLGDKDVPKFPSRREDFKHWRMVMQAYLNARGLWSDAYTGSTVNSTNSESSGKTEEELIGNSAKKNQLIAYSLLLKSFNKKQLELVESIPNGNAIEVWQALVRSYGVNKSTETRISLIEKLNSLNKVNSENVDDFIARVDNLISDLKSVDESISVNQRKYYILRALLNIDEWKIDVQLIKKLDYEDEWSAERLDQHLITEDNSKQLRAKESGKQNKQSNDDAYFVNFRNRSFRGRGGQHSRGRGRYKYESRDERHPNASDRSVTGQWPGQRQTDNHTDNNHRNSGRHREDSDNRRKHGMNHNNKRDITCYNCGKTGHMQRDCWSAPSKRNEKAMHTDDGDESDYSFMVRHTFNPQSDVSNTQHISHSTLNERLVSDWSVTRHTAHHTAHHSSYDVSLFSKLSAYEWVLDGGASRHFTCDRRLLYNIHYLSTPGIAMTNNGESVFDTIGKVDIIIEGHTVTLNDVAYLADFKTNLISVSKMTKKGCEVIYAHDKAVVKKMNRVLFTVPRRGGLYVHTSDEVYATTDGRSTEYTSDDSHDGQRYEDSSENTNEELKTSVSTDTVDIRHAIDNEARDQSAGRDVSVDRSVTGQTEDDEYNKKMNSSRAISKQQSTTIKKLRDLHRKYGHISYSQLYKIITNDVVDGIDIKGVNNSMISILQQEQCHGCLQGKFIRLPTTGTIDYNVHDVMDMWTADIVGPVSDMSLAGHTYIHDMMDVKSRYMLSTLEKNKGDVIDRIVSLVLQWQVYTGKKLKRFHTDNAKEYVNKKLSEFFKSNGTVHTTSADYTPQHNSLIERVHRTLLEMVKSIMYHAKVPMYLWGYAVMFAIWLMNRRLTAANKKKTPIQVMKNMKPNVKNLHVFGCDVWYYNHKAHRDGKLDVTGKPGVFVGYDPHNDSYYRLYSMSEMKVITMKDVRFFDDEFKNAALLRSHENGDEKLIQQTSKEQRLSYISADDYVSDDYDIESLFQQADEKSTSRDEERDQSDTDRSVTGHAVGQNSSSIGDNTTTVNDTVISTSSISSSPTTEGVKKTVHFSAADSDKSKQKTTLREPSSRRRVPVMGNRLIDNVLLSDTVTNDEPSTYKQAMSSDKADEWQKAMNEELQSLKDNKVYTEVEREDDMNVIGCKWVYKIKRNEHGSIKRYKARLVAKGYNQEYGIDYGETFAPVLKYRSKRIVLATAAMDSDTVIEQLDVKTAFLNATVKEDIYVEVPDGVDMVGHRPVSDMSSGKKVWKLNKALYGIKQAPKAWNDNINAFIKSLGYVQCIKDTCMYVKKSKTNRTMMLGLFVDDMMSVYKKQDRDEWNEYKKLMKKKYEISELGEVNHILGMKVTREDEVVKINQQLYIEDKLKMFDMDQCNDISTPEASIKLSVTSENEMLDQKQAALYRGIVGSLLYASISTRPDITHAVNMVSRYMSSPSAQHLVAAKRILRYLQGTKALGLVYRRQRHVSDTSVTGQTLTITGYSDSDWGGDLSDRKSTTGYCVFINGNLISWNTKKQQTVALSTAEAELMAIVEVVKEVKWMYQLLEEMYFKVELPVQIYIDNQSAIKIAQNDIEHDRTKHIDIKYHFLKKEVEEKRVNLNWVSTEKQLADIFTKALGSQIFCNLRDQMMN